MREQFLTVGGAPAVLYGESSGRAFLFVHGQHGCKEEAAELAALACPRGWQVLGVDLPGHGARRAETGRFFPWVAVPELAETAAFMATRWERIALRANSIGAWFSMLAFTEIRPELSLFVSPLLDMERLIRGMMARAGVSEERLKREGEIAVPGGETLSYAYLQYAHQHALTAWDAPTAILYGGRDALTDRATLEAFCARSGCALTVMENGEHWFHTPGQLAVQRDWTEACLLRMPRG